MKCEVMNLLTDESYFYYKQDCALNEEMNFRIESLITTFIINSNNSAILHNKGEREKLKYQITLGKISAGLGNFAVSLR